MPSLASDCIFCLIKAVSILEAGRQLDNGDRPIVRLYIFFLAALLLASVSEAGVQTVTGLAGGGDHSLFIKSDGSLWGMGANSYGELGNGTFGIAPDFSTNQPQLIVDSNVTAVAAGFTHSLFIKTDGSLWAMGNNNFGQLGDGSTDGGAYKTNVPEQIISGNVAMVVAGAYHSLFIKQDGSLWGMGYNSDGGLGIGNNSSTNSPRQIVPTNVVQATAGYTHSLFIKSDGSLWGMGYNGDGELGDGTHNSTNLPELIIASNVVSAAAGYAHSLVLMADGSLWAMGANGNGQLGDGTYNSTNLPELIVASNVVAIAAGYDHSLFLKSDGSLWAVGGNQFGQLGEGTFSGAPFFGENVPEEIVASGATNFAALYAFSLFLKNDGSLWGMGYNQYGQLGDGTNDNQNSPEQIFPQAIAMSIASLRIQLSGTNVNLIWPATVTGVVLQVTDDLTPPVVWTTVTNTPVVANSQCNVATPILGGHRFYRLAVVSAPTGSLQVNLAPAGALGGGASWQVDGGSWQTNGAILTGLPLGSHTVSFSVVSGWNPPASVRVLISSNSITVTNGLYVQQPGSLQVTLQPAGAIGLGALWRVDGGIWQSNGVTVSGLVAGSHTVNFGAAGGWTAPADEVVAIFGNQTSATNGTYILIPDSLKPTNQIISPTAGLSVSNAAFTVTGKAADNVYVASVKYQLNGAVWNLATTTNGWTNWTAAVSLVAGTNLIKACTTDVAGNVSATNTVSFVCVLAAPLAVSTNGVGSITPNDNGLKLVIGQTYSLTAKAGSGCVFSNWTGGISFPLNILTNGLTLQFVMQSNLWLQANFTDTTKPTLTVTSPKSGKTVTSPNLTVIGTATDNWGIAGVWCQLNGGTWIAASGSPNFAKWTNSVTLTNGKNTINSYAQDLGGNFSTTNSLIQTY